MPTRNHRLHRDLDRILVTEKQIQTRIKSLAREIDNTYGHTEITVVALINGAMLFAADLLRKLHCPVRLDCIRVSSYRSDASPQRNPEVIQSITLNITGRHVLMIDDILDTGKTLAAVVKLIRKLNPASVRTCVLLNKKGRREIEFTADFVGFEIPDTFVVGYGLDFAERYRNLPAIGVLKPELQNPPEWTG